MTEQKIHAAKVVFYICLFSAIGLLIGGFFAPPIGIIDNSLLAAVGLLLLFAVVAIWGRSIDLGRRATFQKGDLTLQIEGDEAEIKENS